MTNQIYPCQFRENTNRQFSFFKYEKENKSPNLTERNYNIMPISSPSLGTKTIALTGGWPQ